MSTNFGRKEWRLIFACIAACRVSSLALVFRITAFGIAAFGSAVCTAQENAAGLAIERVAVGFDGQYKSGYWTPVEIVVRGGDKAFRGELALTVLDGDGVPLRHQWSGQTAVDIPARGETTLHRNVKFGRANERLRVELRDSSDDASQSTSSSFDLSAPLSSDRELILSIGAPIGIQEALARRTRISERAAFVCHLKSLSNLPDEWLGYEGVDLVVISTSDVKVIESFTDQQLVALRQWVESGGKLLLCIGAHGTELLGPGGRLAPFAPGVFRQVVSLHSNSTLEAYAGASRQLNADAIPNGIPLSMLGETRGKVAITDAAPSGPRPVLVRSPMAFGEVTFVALDLDQPPFTQWEGRPRLIDRLLREATGREDVRQDAAPTAQTVQFGYKDMSGQLRSAMEQYQGVTLVAFSWVAGLVLLYVVIIGPVDYFLLRDLLRRMHWTWISFPIAVIFFVALTVLLNARFQGAGVKLNQLELVDVDESTSIVRGTSWAHIYSPHAGLYDVRVQPIGRNCAASQELDCVLAWHGFPGTALGGLDGGTTVPAAMDEYQLVFDKQYDSQLAGAPLPVSSTKSFLARWWGKVNVTQPASLSIGPDGLLRGEVVNPMPVPLTDCMVFYENWVYRLDSRRGVLAPAERLVIERENGLNLQWRLSGRRVENSKDISTPWDQNTLDVWKVLEMMMFHSAAGGENYTQLSNRYQGYIDLSRHLDAGRAMLVGRSRVAPTEWLLNGKPLPESDTQHWTYYRIVFPVTPLAKANP